MHSNLDRVQADSQHVGDLLIGQTLVLTEDHSRSIRRREGVDVPADALVHLLPNELLVDTERFLRGELQTFDRPLSLALQ